MLKFVFVADILRNAVFFGGAIADFENSLLQPLHVAILFGLTVDLSQRVVQIAIGDFFATLQARLLKRITFEKKEICLRQEFEIEKKLLLMVK